VVKQLPVEIPQQCSSVSSCISTHTQTWIIMKKQYTGCQHSTPLVMNGLTLFCWYFTVHIWCYCGYCVVIVVRKINNYCVFQSLVGHI
jgi:hypothetical protein